MSKYAKSNENRGLGVRGQQLMVASSGEYLQMS